MLKRNCKDCKYWIRWGKTVGDCKRLTQKTNKNDDVCRVYSDSEPISTEINFGCIHFEEYQD